MSDRIDLMVAISEAISTSASHPEEDEDIVRTA